MITIEYLENTQDVYDITVEPSHCFYANDILVHNCVEIDLPTEPLNDIDDPHGEISLCTLSAINWGKIRTPSDFERPAKLVVRALNELIDSQDYPIVAAEKSTHNRRPIGVGTINFAYWMVQNDMSYTNPNYDLIHEYCEAYSYYLIKASADLAAELDTIPGFEDSKYCDGILPIDTYKKTVDEITSQKYKMPWEELRKQLKKTGIYNSTLMAGMPSETSSQVSNATNGIEPPRSLVSVKGSKDGGLPQVVPWIHRYKNKYELLWDIKSPEGYIKIASVFQKFMDQGISVNTTYNPAFYEDDKIPMSEMIGHLLMFYQYGGKQLYYCNIKDNATDDNVEMELEDIEDEECDACTI